jgi:hypothetical protein
MQSVSSDVDELSRRWSCRQVRSSRKPLVRGTCKRSRDDHAAQTNEDAYRPTPHVDIVAGLVFGALPTRDGMSVLENVELWNALAGSGQILTNGEDLCLPECGRRIEIAD